MAGFHPRNDFQLTLVVLFEVSIGAVPNRPKGNVNKNFKNNHAIICKHSIYCTIFFHFSLLFCFIYNCRKPSHRAVTKEAKENRPVRNT